VTAHIFIYFYLQNGQLGVENPAMKDKYHSKSIAEQNSLDIGWNLLMEDRFAALRNCLFTTQAEIKRFRQVSLMVTVYIIMDWDCLEPALTLALSRYFSLSTRFL